MMEQLDLTSAIPAKGGTSFWRVRGLNLWYDDDNPDNSFVKLTVVGENGERQSVTWEGNTAHGMIQALNKANLSGNSLHKRALTQAVSSGLLGDGSINGNPD